MNKKNFFIIIVFSIFSNIALFSQSDENFQDDYDKDFLQELENTQQNTSINPDLQDNLTIILSAHNYDLNPHTATYSSEAQIINGLYEGLFTYDPISLEPCYALATAYKISRDKKRWTFILRDDAKFSDGTKITAQDIKDSWLGLLENKRASFSSLFDIIKGAQTFRTTGLEKEKVAIYVHDQNQLSLTLNAPAAHLPKLLCMNAFSVVKKDVFSGAFKLQTYTPTHIILEKNNYYYDAQKTYLKKITFDLNDNSADNSYAFNTGTADWISGPVDLPKILNKNASKICAEFATEYYFFKIRDNIWKNPEFRVALLEAVPWEELRKSSIVPASTLVYPINGYPQVQGFIYTDKAEAISLMNQAKQNANIPLEQRLSITIAIIEGREDMKNDAEILKTTWDALNVDVNILEVNQKLYLYAIPQIQADIFNYTWIGDFADPLAFLELFRSNSTMNVTNWKNKEYDTLLNDSALFTDQQHNELLSKAEQLLLDQAIILPIQHPISLNIIDLNTVGGWSVNSFDIHPLKYLFKKEEKVKIPNLVFNRP